METNRYKNCLVSGKNGYYLVTMNCIYRLTYGLP